ncbi:MAG: condensation domain-containing protein, partial [Eubacterium sp.]
MAAYVVADEPLDLKALEDFIGKELPSYMIPAAITVVDAIPLNANGKVDKRKLPAPEFNMEVEAEEAEPTERKLTVFEEKLRDIAEHILGHANFGITSNLMKAGLTSLSAIQMIMEISDAFHIDLPVKILLSGGSILSVENALLEALLSGRLEPSAAVETAPKALKEAYPLTESQWGVYYDAVKHPDTIMYNIPVQIRLAKDIDALRLQKAAASVLTAHPILGTHLKKDETGLVQVYRETAPETITVKEMTEEGLSRYRLAFVKPFDLFEGPLYRMEIVKTEAALYLLFDVHHLVFDGGSLDIFMTQLDESYGGTAPIKEQCTYYHYAEIEKEQAESAAYKEARAYFDQSLLDFESASKISPDRSEKESTGQLKEVVRGISAQKLEAFCADQGITPAQLFFAASAYAVSRHTASREVFLATISSGRSDLKLRDTFGMFVKTLPLSLKIDPQKTVLELLQTAQENLINTTANEIYPFTKLAADYGYAPDIMYACELGVLKDFNLDGQPATLLPLGLEVPKFKISIHIEEREGQPAVCVQYNDALYTEDLMTVFAQSIARTAEAMMAEPQTKAGGISMLSEEQKSQIKGFEKTAEAPLLEERLHVLFENQAAAKKDHVALIAVDRTYSYKELNQAANRIAAGLIKSGVKQGDRVAFVLPRTSRVILSELGILKAGAAFIPCDPEYPMERIEQILEDSDAAYVIAPMGFT